jgi:hypothetical protein
VASIWAVAHAGLEDHLPEGMTRYEGPYHVLYTDVDKPVVREAVFRLKAMAEEYHRRTKGFSGTIRRRLPFVLFKSGEDYKKMGMPEGSAGAFTGRVLLATYRGQTTWRIVQHEGFHQFVHSVIRGEIPIWVNEGLAEYFGEGIWTGDGMVTGVVPPARLARLREHIREKRLLPTAAMLKMSHREWNAKLSGRNYDQAWSMVHFLVHADDGKYRKAFSSFINDLSRGLDWQDAYRRRFGSDTEAFEEAYSKWWIDLPEDHSHRAQREAVVQTLTSYLARARALGQSHESAEAFFEAVEKGKVQVDPSQKLRLWLPNSLGQRAVKQARKLSTWTLDSPEGGLASLTLRTDDGIDYEGSFRLLRNGSVEIDVEVSESPTDAKEES